MQQAAPSNSASLAAAAGSTGAQSAAGSSSSSSSSMFGARQIDPENLEDLLLCLSYLKQRELFLYKMAEDPSHKAMLYFLELMMNSESPLPVAYLASKLNGRQFTPEMVRAVGEHEDSLRRFLARYPSLFSLNGNFVSLNDITSVSNTMMLTPTPTPTSAPPPSAPASAATSSTPSGQRATVAKQTVVSEEPATGPKSDLLNGSSSARQLTAIGSHSFACSNVVANALASIQRQNSLQPPHNAHVPSSVAAQIQNAPEHGSNTRRFDEGAFLLESEAVRYFTEKLVRRGERWVPIKSLAGHLSQASADIRQVVGPQSRFRKFLLSNPRVFDVQADRDLVALREEIRREYLAAYPELDPDVPSHLSPADGPSAALLRAGRTPAGGRPKSLNLSAERASTTAKLLAYSRSRKTVNTNTNGKMPARSACRASSLLDDVLTCSAEADSLTDADAQSDADAASLLNALGAAECDWPASQCSGPETPLELLVEPHSAFSATSPNANSGHAVSALRDALANAVRDGTQTRTSRRPNAPASRAQPSVSANRADCSSSSSSSSEANNGPRRNRKASAPATASNPQAVTMTADEYAAVDFVRKFVERTIRQAPESCSCNTAPIQLLVAALGEQENESVRKAIGWTLTELEAFLKKHSTFFELSYSDVSAATPAAPDAPPANATCRLATVANRRLSRNAHIIIAGGTGSHDDPCVSGRTMTNRCGRIFHVVKLWGIVDLGRHEHVFFDKSLFKHVDDLSKYFHVGQTVWFNAILAPKDSRAKWRATQVWNAADKLLFDRAQPSTASVCPTAPAAPGCANANLSPGASASVPKTESATDCELLTGQPKVRMHLADDVRFLADADNDEDLIKLLDNDCSLTLTLTPSNAAAHSGRKTSYPLVTLADEKTLEMRTGTLPEDNLLYATNREDVKMSEYVVPMPMPLPGDEDDHTRGATRRRSGDRQRLTDAACQTLSTGDILATQLYHEDSS